MSTQQQIDDPGQWRVGDVFEGESEGHPFSGPIWMDGVGQMVVGATYIRNRDGAIEADVTGHVTRTVEPIPEPTEPWALVRFADNSTALRDEGIDDEQRAVNERGARRARAAIKTTEEEQ